MSESTTILTASGLTLDLAHPEPGSICWTDIVFGLSHQGRFSGQTMVFWNVGQHSVEVALWLRVHNEPPEVQWEGLMHDAEEAYPPGDVARPYKYLPEMRDGMKVQQRVRAVIEGIYGLPRCKSAPVAEADKTVQQWERIALASADHGDSAAWSPAHARFMFHLTALTILSEMPHMQALFNEIATMVPTDVQYAAVAIGILSGLEHGKHPIGSEAGLAADLRDVFKRHGFDPDQPQFSQYIGALEKMQGAVGAPKGGKLPDA